MITKRKGLCLGLLLSLLSIGNAVQALRLDVIAKALKDGIVLLNATTKNVKFYVDYKGSICRNDRKWIGPSDSKFIKTRLCTVKTVIAKVYFKDGSFETLTIESEGFNAFTVSEKFDTYVITGTRM